MYNAIIQLTDALWLLWMHLEQQMPHIDKTFFGKGIKETEQWNTGERNKEREVVSQGQSLMSPPGSMTQRRQRTSGWRFSWIRSCGIDTLPGIPLYLQLGMPNKNYLLSVWVCNMCAVVIMTLCRKRMLPLFLLLFCPVLLLLSPPLKEIDMFLQVITPGRKTQRKHFLTVIHKRITERKAYS